MVQWVALWPWFLYAYVVSACIPRISPCHSGFLLWIQKHAVRQIWHLEISRSDSVGVCLSMPCYGLASHLGCPLPHDLCFLGWVLIYMYTACPHHQLVIHYSHQHIDVCIAQVHWNVPFHSSLFSFQGILLRSTRMGLTHFDWFWPQKVMFITYQTP